jgi:hypothetical protein
MFTAVILSTLGTFPNLEPCYRAFSSNLLVVESQYTLKLTQN